MGTKLKAKGRGEKAATFRDTPRRDRVSIGRNQNGNSVYASCAYCTHAGGDPRLPDRCGCTASVYWKQAIQDGQWCSDFDRVERAAQQPIPPIEDTDTDYSE